MHRISVAHPGPSEDAPKGVTVAFESETNGARPAAVMSGYLDKRSSYGRWNSRFFTLSPSGWLTYVADGVRPLLGNDWAFFVILLKAE